MYYECMEIGYPLVQFRNEKALFIVSSAREAEFYLAENGRIEKRDGFKIPKPRYLDREGFFMKSGHGRVFGSGEVYRDLKLYVENKFLKKLQKKVGDFLKEKKVEAIYLFAPDYMAGMVLKYLPNKSCDLLKMCVYGNFIRRHPLELVEKIQRVFGESIGLSVPRKKEAWRILALRTVK
ncbi:MAG: hypothetical protein QG620_315 [Patescibacteria group bacterium]|nr:hypothetical protein [Patescibacteria group bacterium]